MKPDRDYDLVTVQFLVPIQDVGLEHARWAIADELQAKLPYVFNIVRLENREMILNQLPDGEFERTDKT